MNVTNHRHGNPTTRNTSLLYIKLLDRITNGKRRPFSFDSIPVYVRRRAPSFRTNAIAEPQGSRSCRSPSINSLGPRTHVIQVHVPSILAESANGPYGFPSLCLHKYQRQEFSFDEYSHGRTLRESLLFSSRTSARYLCDCWHHSFDQSYSERQGY